MEDGKKWHVDESTRKKMSDAHRQSWDSGERQHPITKLKVQNLSLQERLDRVESEVTDLRAEVADLRAEVAELRAWRERMQTAARRHSELMQKGAAKEGPAGDMCRDLLDALGS
jgi:predicted RNase H-like nuclease (RuvC/YqgF family)